MLHLMGELDLVDQVPKLTKSWAIENQSQEHLHLGFNQTTSKSERFPEFEGQRSPRKESLGTHVWSPKTKLQGNHSKTMNEKSRENSSENQQKEKRWESKRAQRMNFKSSIHNDEWFFTKRLASSQHPTHLKIISMKLLASLEKTREKEKNKT